MIGGLNDSIINKILSVFEKYPQIVEKAAKNLRTGFSHIN